VQRRQHKINGAKMMFYYTNISVEIYCTLQLLCPTIFLFPLPLKALKFICAKSRHILAPKMSVKLAPWMLPGEYLWLRLVQLTSSLRLVVFVKNIVSECKAADQI
jgi:hypothetical protein